MKKLYCESIYDVEDENGFITWDIAHQASKEHNVCDDFYEEYGDKNNLIELIETDQFLSWLGY